MERQLIRASISSRQPSEEDLGKSGTGGQKGKDLASLPGFAGKASVLACTRNEVIPQRKHALIGQALWTNKLFVQYGNVTMIFRSHEIKVGIPECARILATESTNQIKSWRSEFDTLEAELRTTTQSGPCTPNKWR
jgi:hypothetical protein